MYVKHRHEASQLFIITPFKVKWVIWEMSQSVELFLKTAQEVLHAEELTLCELKCVCVCLNHVVSASQIRAAPATGKPHDEEDTRPATSHTDGHMAVQGMPWLRPTLFTDRHSADELKCNYTKSSWGFRAVRACKCCPSEPEKCIHRNHVMTVKQISSA